MRKGLLALPEPCQLEVLFVKEFSLTIDLHLSFFNGPVLTDSNPLGLI